MIYKNILFKYCLTKGTGYISSNLFNYLFFPPFLFCPFFNMLFNFGFPLFSFLIFKCLFPFLLWGRRFSSWTDDGAFVIIWFVTATDTVFIFGVIFPIYNKIKICDESFFSFYPTQNKQIFKYNETAKNIKVPKKQNQPSLSSAAESRVSLGNMLGVSSTPDKSLFNPMIVR